MGPSDVYCHVITSASRSLINMLRVPLLLILLCYIATSFQAPIALYHDELARLPVIDTGNSAQHRLPYIGSRKDKNSSSKGSSSNSSSKNSSKNSSSKDASSQINHAISSITGGSAGSHKSGQDSSG